MAPKLEDALRYLPAHMHDALTRGKAARWRCAAHLQAVLQDVSSYLPARVVRERLAAAGPAGASGQFAHGTLMFADISGFTAMSERLSALGREWAEVITRIVNGYFDTMLGIALSYGGDVESSEEIGEEGLDGKVGVGDIVGHHQGRKCTMVGANLCVRPVFEAENLGYSHYLVEIETF